MKQAPQIILARDLADREFPWPLVKLAPKTDSVGLTTFTFSDQETWFPARPLSLGGFLTRVRLAWGVFTGRYDALRWDNQ